jgi:hypothetical protein
MLRIPQAKIEWILSWKKRCPIRIEWYEALGGDDPELMEIVRGIAMAKEQHWAGMSKLQDWVRSEYAAKGYVEVDEDSVELAAPLPPHFADTDEEGELEEEEEIQTPQYQEAPVLMVMDA